MSDLFFKTFDETKVWLDQMRVKHYTIRDDLTVDVDGRVDILHGELKHIPVQFGVVKGDFWCPHNGLTDLIGSPKECVSFYCHNNQLTSLEGAPAMCKK